MGITDGEGPGVEKRWKDSGEDKERRGGVA